MIYFFLVLVVPCIFLVGYAVGWAQGYGDALDEVNPPGYYPDERLNDGDEGGGL